MDNDLEIWAKLFEKNAMALARALMEHGVILVAQDREEDEEGETFGLAWEALQTSLHCS